MPDTRLSTEVLLMQVEHQLDLIDTGLHAPSPDGLQEASGELRRSAVAFAGVLESALSAEVFDTGFRQRIETVAQRLSNQRQALARRNAMVERALASMMKPRGAGTYSLPGERSSFGGSGYAVAH